MTLDHCKYIKLGVGHAHTVISTITTVLEGPRVEEGQGFRDFETNDKKAVMRPDDIFSLPGLRPFEVNQRLECHYLAVASTHAQ